MVLGRHHLKWSKTDFFSFFGRLTFGFHWAQESYSGRWTILILHWTVLKSQDKSAYRRNKSWRTGQARAAWAGLAEKAGSKGLNLGRRVPMKTGQGEEGEGDSSPQGSKAWEARLWASHQGPAGMPQQMRQVSRRRSQRPEVRGRLRACDSYSYWWNNDPSPAALWLSSHAAFSSSLLSQRSMWHLPPTILLWTV